MIDTRSRDVLELDRVLGFIGGFAVTATAREQIRALEMTEQPSELHHRFGPVKDLLSLFEKNSSIPLRGFPELREFFNEVGIGGTVLPREAWLAIEQFLCVCRDLCAFAVRPEHRSLDALQTILAEVVYPDAFHRRLIAIFDDNGNVRDNASPALARIRSDRRNSEQRMLRESQRLASDYFQRGYLQENFTTVRNGRVVFPVKASHKSRLSGIIHSASGSKETIFVEPAELVELANGIELLLEAENEELYRIFAELSTELRAILITMEMNLEKIVLLDRYHAIARVSWKQGWNLPNFEPRSSLRLFNAHHPILQIFGSSSVPVSIVLDRNDRCIVLSGPNAGGKTTSMKLVGLLILMAQSGIPIPVSPESSLPIFSTVLADIGDQQSLTDGLSTFSGHIRRIGSIYTQANAKTLVLLDELGTGTDPQEGTALALALLDGFLNRAALTLTTSHLGPVKQWAEDTPGARNASFSLDPETHRPTYRLRLDLPGASEALEIARNEGLPEEILSKARSIVGEKHLRMGELLLRIEEKERRLSQAVRDAEARAKSLGEQEELSRQRAELLRIERREAREKALKEKEQVVASIREKIERQIAELPSEDDIARRREALLRVREDALREQRLSNEERRRLAESMLEKGEIFVGQNLYLPRMRKWGIVREVEAGGKKVRLRIGDLEVVVKTDELLDYDPEEKRAQAQEKEQEISGRTILKKKKSKRIKNALRNATEYSGPSSSAIVTFAGRSIQNVSRPSSMLLDLHGFRVEEALTALDRFIDQSLLANYPYIKVCHGTGTGRLYRAVHEYLRNHPSVRSFRFGTPEEGGGGMTIVDL